MTGRPEPGDAMTAVLLQLADHADRLARLDEREAGHHQQATGQLAELAGAARQPQPPARRRGSRQPGRARLPASAGAAVVAAGRTGP